MIIAVDFDGTLVQNTSGGNLLIMPGARAGLASLRAAGHVLLVYSARANRAQREDPQLDPLVRVGVRKPASGDLQASQAHAQARYLEMVEFVAREFPGVFAAVDDGAQGKPLVDLFIDDLAIRFGHGATALGWRAIASIWGEPVYSRAEDHSERRGQEAEQR